MQRNIGTEIYVNAEKCRYQFVNIYGMLDNYKLDNVKLRRK